MDVRYASKYGCPDTYPEQKVFRTNKQTKGVLYHKVKRSVPEMEKKNLKSAINKLSYLQICFKDHLYSPYNTDSHWY